MTARFGLQEAAAAFEHGAARTGVKTVILPGS